MATAKPQEFDIIVIGSSFSSYYSASVLSQASYKVALISDRPENTISPSLDGLLKLIPHTEDNKTSLQTLKSFLPLEFSEIEIIPKTYEGKEEREFLGFGENTSAAIRIFDLWNQKKWLHLSQAPHELLPHLSFEGRSFPASSITQIQKKEQEASLAYEITLNGHQSLYAPKVIFCDSPLNLLSFFPSDLSPRAHQKLSKAKPWSLMTLQIQQSLPTSPQKSSSGELFIFSGKMRKNEQPEPVVGRLFPSHSVWIAPLLTEDLANHDLSVAIYRNIKKFSQKALKEATPTQEAVVILKDAYGFLNLPLKEGLCLPALPSFHLCHPLITEKAEGFIADLQMAHEILSYLLPESTLRDKPSLNKENSISP
ncbi:MAG: hypothetical protein D6797_09080 [Bdellovibrio sp.]|nr:MAG: hypothetical protein D6797_09080 [Bdellovibrio sp.]